MHPLTMDPKEMAILVRRTRETADAVLRKSGRRVAYLVGTMIELPRAAVTADRIAEEAEFFSFGTNDLTQTTFGFSRDDAATQLHMNDIGRVRLRCTAPLFVDEYRRNQTTGSFILIDEGTNETVGAGMIIGTGD